jgi:hypothetical protein
MHLREIMRESIVWIKLVHDTVWLLAFLNMVTNDWEFLDQLSNYKLLKKDFELCYFCRTSSFTDIR